VSWNIEKLIKAVYRGWRKTQPFAQSEHPNEEVLTSFLEGKLPFDECENLKSHLISCKLCSESLALALKSPEEELSNQADKPILGIALKLKDHFFELLNTTGDILVGQELLPAPVLRSRSIRDFKDEILIYKDFEKIRVEVKIENKAGKSFNLHITARQKLTQKVIKNLRVTLISEDHELESYITDSGSVIFEHVLLGKYKLEIAGIDNKLASILVDIKI